MTSHAAETPRAEVTAPSAGGHSRARKSDRRNLVAALGFLSPNLIGFLIFTIIPIVASLVLSFFEWPLIGDMSFAGFSNFEKLVTTDPVFWQVVRNTLYYLVGYVVLNIIVSLGMALWLTSRIRFRAIYRFIFFLPVVSPMVANALVWRMLYQRDTGIFAQIIKALTGNTGPDWLGDPHWAMPAIIIMSVWAGFGYNMIILIAGLEAIPESLTEAAQIDGASWWGRTLRVRLPLLTPSLFFATVMTVMSSLQVFAQPFIMTGGGPGSSTATIVYYLYQKGFISYEMGYASAIAWFLFMLILLVTFVQFIAQKKWVHYQ